MAKAKVTDLIAQGFRSVQFGMQEGDAWSGSEGYLATLLGEAGRWAASRVGSAYATLQDPSYAHDCVKRAEVQFARSELFRRRISFIDSSANLALQNPAHAERRGYERDAASAWDAAIELIEEAQREIGVAVTTAPVASMCVVESGRFPSLVTR